METTDLMAIAIEPRGSHAPKVQEILTSHGCIIKTRLGLHETSENSCSKRGLIILQLCGNDEQNKELEIDLQKLDGVSVKMIAI